MKTTAVECKSVSGLLIGSLAITVSHGILGSPAPDRLMADTLNSYAAPSKTSFTAYFLSVDKGRSICSLRLRHSNVANHYNHAACHINWVPVIGPSWFTRLQ